MTQKPTAIEIGTATHSAIEVALELQAKLHRKEIEALQKKFDEEHHLRCDLERRFDHRLSGDHPIRAKADKYLSRKEGETAEMAEARETIIYLHGVIQGLEAGPALAADEVNVAGNDKISGDFLNLVLQSTPGLDPETKHWGIVLTAEDPGDDDSVTCVALDEDGAKEAGNWLLAASAKLARFKGTK